MTVTMIAATAPSTSWTARTRGTSVRCLAVAAAAVAHNPIATAIASPGRGGERATIASLTGQAWSAA